MKLYLDTSVLSVLFQDDSPQRQSATRYFLEHNLETREHRLFVSSVVFEEIRKTPDPGRMLAMLRAVDLYGMRTLDWSADASRVRELAGGYARLGAIPATKLADCLHVAIATIYHVDVLLTWNFRHLGGVRRERLIDEANSSLGYQTPLKLRSPEELAFP